MARRRTPRSVAAGAVVGTFVVGDGTLVGQGPAPQPNKPKLILNGKAFVTAVYADFHQMQAVKSRLILKGKQVTIQGSSTLVPGKAKLTLKAKTVSADAAVQMFVGKPKLILNAKAFAIGSGATEDVGKGKLYLRGKHVTAGQVALIPTIPITIDLVPTVPQDYDLVPTTPQSYDLVPTGVESR